MPTVRTERWWADGTGLTFRRGRGSRPTTTDRTQLVYGDYRPDGNTAGVLPNVPRTNYNDPSTAGFVGLSTSGATYTNLDFYGDINIIGINNSFHNCYFHGGIGHPTFARGCVTLTSSTAHTGSTFYDCTAEAQSPSYYRDGWVGNNYVAERCESFHNNDGFGVFGNAASGGAAVGIYGCYVHDLVYFSQDPAHADGSHNDCIQFQGGANFTARGNNLVGTSYDDPSTITPNPRGGNYLNGQVIMLNQTTAPASGVVIDRNWLSGGSAGINTALNGRTTWPATITSNQWDRDIYNAGTAGAPDYWYVVINNGGTGYNFNGLYPVNVDNRFTDDGTLLTVGKTSGIRVF